MILYKRIIFILNSQLPNVTKKGKYKQKLMRDRFSNIIITEVVFTNKHPIFAYNS